VCCCSTRAQGNCCSTAPSSRILAWTFPRVRTLACLTHCLNCRRFGRVRDRRERAVTRAAAARGHQTRRVLLRHPLQCKSHGRWCCPGALAAHCSASQTANVCACAGAPLRGHGLCACAALPVRQRDRICSQLLITPQARRRARRGRGSGVRAGSSCTAPASRCNRRSLGDAAGERLLRRWPLHAPTAPQCLCVSRSRQNC
jgi:hypothetical protein